MFIWCGMEERAKYDRQDGGCAGSSLQPRMCRLVESSHSDPTMLTRELKKQYRLIIIALHLLLQQNDHLDVQACSRRLVAPSITMSSAKSHTKCSLGNPGG